MTESFQERLLQIPNAENVKQKILVKRELEDTREVERCLLAIEQAVKDQAFSVQISPPLRSLRLISHLKTLGYLVKTRNTGPNEISTELIW